MQKDYSHWYPNPEEDARLEEELGAENERIRQQIRNADQNSAGILTKPKIRVANDRQVGGNHYKDMSIQPWDVIDTYPFEQAIGYYRGTAEAYLMRAGHKGPELEDYEKALHVLEKLVEFYKKHRG